MTLSVPVPAMWLGRRPGLASWPVTTQRHPHPHRDGRGGLRAPGRAIDRPVDRRSLLRGGVGLAALAGIAAACSEQGETVSEGVSAGPDQTLTALFPRDIAYTAAGVSTRLPFTLSDAEGIPLASIAGPLGFTVSIDGEQVGDTVEIAPRSDGVPRPYLPLYFEFPDPGIYDVETEYEGNRLNSQVQVFPADEVQQPLVGSVLPSADTPTFQQSFDVDPICTRTPTCPFHDVNLAQAIGTGRPVVVLLATPAYCRTTACGPILDILIEVAGGRDDLVVIHSEVYKNPKSVTDLAEATLAPLPEAYDMTFEPCLFVTNSANELVVRGDIVVDRGEMQEMLALAV